MKLYPQETALLTNGMRLTNVSPKPLKFRDREVVTKLPKGGH